MGFECSTGGGIGDWSVIASSIHPGGLNHERPVSCDDRVVATVGDVDASIDVHRDTDRGDQGGLVLILLPQATWIRGEFIKVTLFCRARRSTEAIFPGLMRLCGYRLSVFHLPAPTLSLVIAVRIPLIPVTPCHRRSPPTR